MVNILILVLAAVLLAGLLYFEKTENQLGRLPTKTALSSLFILAAMIQPHPISRYYQFVLLALAFCLGGDVFLALPQKKMFLIGLISFLCGHIFYIIALFSVAQLSKLTLVGSLTGLVISGGVYSWLRPHLGSMKTPVLIYVIVITVMLSGACTVLGDSTLVRTGRIMVFAGALSFYFSDLFVARDRFLKREFQNRIIGLPMYYTGQFLLAFSVGLLG
jgi:uncharacterized membrane protein YhhN